MDEVKAEDIVILDLQGLTLIADYFVLGTARSDTQMRAICEQLEERAAEHGYRLLHREGEYHARWVLLDLGDVVVHLFHPEARTYYDLEQLWADAGRVERSQVA